MQSNCWHSIVVPNVKVMQHAVARSIYFHSRHIQSMTSVWRINRRWFQWWGTIIQIWSAVCRTNWTRWDKNYKDHWSKKLTTWAHSPILQRALLLFYLSLLPGNWFLNNEITLTKISMEVESMSIVQVVNLFLVKSL